MKFLVLITVISVLLKQAELRSLTKTKLTDPRIIGGNKARAGQFPYAAAIQVKTVDSTFFCGGSLLSPLWILTSGHCVENGIQFNITLGSNLLNQNDVNKIIVSTSNYFLHPEFNRTTLDNNLGLIQLRQNVPFSDYIGKLYLPVIDYDEDVEVTAIGWGQISDEEPGPVEYLNYVNLITIANAWCKLAYGSQITDKMICVAGEYNEGTCTGDSGTPLIYLLDDRHPIVVAVSSFISSRGCESSDPSGYVRVYPYLNWISNITGLSGFGL